MTIFHIYGVPDWLDTLQKKKKQFSLCDIINITIYIWLNLKIKLYSVFVLIFSSKNPSEQRKLVQNLDHVPCVCTIRDCILCLSFKRYQLPFFSYHHFPNIYYRIIKIKSSSKNKRGLVHAVHIYLNVFFLLYV